MAKRPASDFQFEDILGDFAPRNYLHFHNSVSRLRRLKMQTVINSCIDAEYGDVTSWKNRWELFEAQRQLLDPKFARKRAAAAAAAARAQQQQQQAAAAAATNKKNAKKQQDDDEGEEEEENSSNDFLDNNNNNNEKQPKLQIPQHRLPMPPIGTGNCEIRMITDPAHPAYRQCGLFAVTKIAKDQLIMVYAGLVSITGSQQSSAAYIMTFGGNAYDGSLGIDAEVMGNFCRFANDARGTGLEWNAFARVEKTRLGESATVIQAKRTICAGEEILLDYGKEHALRNHQWNARSGRTLTSERTVTPLGSFAETVLGNNDNNSDKLSHLRAVWRCLQCGNINDGGAALTVSRAAAVRCVHCQQPRANETRTSLAVVRGRQGSSSSNNDNDDDDDDDDEKDDNKLSLMKLMQPGPDQPEGLCAPSLILDRPAVAASLKNNGNGKNSSMAKEQRRLSPVEKSKLLLEQKQTMAAERSKQMSVVAEWPRQLWFITWQIYDPEANTVEINEQHIFAAQPAIAVRQASKELGVGFGTAAAAGGGGGGASSGASARKNSSNNNNKKRAAAEAAMLGSSGGSVKLQLAAKQVAVNDEVACVGGVLADVKTSSIFDTMRQPNRRLCVLTKYISDVASRPSFATSSGGELDANRFVQLVPVSTTPAEMVRRCTPAAIAHDPRIQQQQQQEQDAPLPAALDFIFFATNEVANIRVATNGGGVPGALPRKAFVHCPAGVFVQDRSVRPNATLKWVRDPLGYIYIALVAVADVAAWDELVL